MKCIKCGKEAVGIVMVIDIHGAYGSIPTIFEGRCKDHLKYNPDELKTIRADGSDW